MLPIWNSSLVVNWRSWPVVFNSLNSCLAGLGGRVGLTGTNALAISGLEVEHRLAVCRVLALIARIFRRVRLD